jgi:adenosylcobinamide-GDP ribazoletransferase
MVPYSQLQGEAPIIIWKSGPAITQRGCGAGVKSFLVALAFLTIAPIRVGELPDDATFARSRFWYPAVGLLLGLLLASLTLLVSGLDNPHPSAFLILAAWALITGALHLDGFCDLCDGLFGGGTTEDRLRIMKDPRRGTFAVVGCVLLLLGKYSALVELLQAGPAILAAWSVAMAVFAARCLVLTVSARARYPREEGTGKIIVEATGPIESTLFAVLAVLVLAAAPMILPIVAGILEVPVEGRLAAIAGAGPSILLLLVPPGLVLALLRWTCCRRLGGITGDCLGAAIELGELMFLLAVAGWPG